MRPALRARILRVFLEIFWGKARNWCGGFVTPGPMVDGGRSGCGWRDWSARLGQGLRLGEALRCGEGVTVRRRHRPRRAAAQAQRICSAESYRVMC